MKPSSSSATSHDGVTPQTSVEPDWTAIDVLTAYADVKGWVTAKAGRPDIHRAGNASEFQILCFRRCCDTDSVMMFVSFEIFGGGEGCVGVLAAWYDCISNGYASTIGNGDLDSEERWE